MRQGTDRQGILQKNAVTDDANKLYQDYDPLVSTPISFVMLKRRIKPQSDTIIVSRTR